MRRCGIKASKERSLRYHITSNPRDDNPSRIYGNWIESSANPWPRIEYTHPRIFLHHRSIEFFPSSAAVGGGQGRLNPWTILRIFVVWQGRFELWLTGLPTWFGEIVVSSPTRCNHLISSFASFHFCFIFIFELFSRLSKCSNHWIGANGHGYPDSKYYHQE